VGELERLHGPVEVWWSDRGQKLRDTPAAPLAEDAGRVDAGTASALDRLERIGFRAIEASAWPRLLTLPDPPAILFQRGIAWERGRAALAVVGARRATAYGLRVTEALAGGVARKGVAVLSGLARGIDAAAHRAALAAGGATLAVLGCGPDRAYPPEHRELQERIGRDGVVLSEYLPGTPPKPPHFPRRNRILVALADAVLVVEARKKSGTLTSAAWAADLGREVLVVPGPIDSELSEAPIELLREGATPVGCVAHVLEALGVAADAAPQAPARPGFTLTEPEQRLLALLEGGPLDLDELVRLAGEAPSQILTRTLSLEARGVLLREADGRSFRKPGSPARG
jgi:DNA processing protein